MRTGSVHERQMVPAISHHFEAVQQTLSNRQVRITGVQRKRTVSLAYGRQRTRIAFLTTKLREEEHNQIAARTTKRTLARRILCRRGTRTG